MSEKKNLLIVDDAQINRDILAALFQKDFNILQAENGVKALEVLRQYRNKVSVVLLDILMPRMDGIQTLKAMHADPTLASIPVIVSSGADESEYRLKAMEQGALDYITKPIDPRLVSVRVQSAVSRAENVTLRATNTNLQKQKDEEERYRDILESTQTVVLEYSVETGRFFYDSAIHSTFRGSFEGKDFFAALKADRIATPEDAEMLEGLFRAGLNDKFKPRLTRDVLLKTVSGANHYFRIQMLFKRSGSGTPNRVLITINDVNEQVLSQQELQYLAEYDKLTGIYNRNAFAKLTAKMLAENPKVTYMVVRFDIEKFKAVNDVFGRAQGDRLLGFMAKNLKRFAEPLQGTYARLEADVFALCIPYTEANVVGMMSISTQDTRSFKLDMEIMASFGIYIVDDNTLSVDAMIDRAMLAQQTVKGNYVKRFAFYDEALRAELLQEREIVTQMATALDSKQFQVYLQPKVSLRTNQIIGAEALVRWVHPQKGVVPPGIFIPVFEKNGFIMKLDAYVWEQVCVQLRGWLDKGLSPLPISVNISRVNIYNPNLCAILIGLVNKYSLPDGLLQLEVTESAYTDNPKLMIEVVNELHKRGFTMLMDDFGSGYSSLNMLKELPVDMLKIDLRFLAGNDESGKGSDILTSVVRMAKWLGLPVTAEGVETNEQAAFLRSLGCDDAQGYLFYRPISIMEYERLYIPPEERQTRNIQKEANDEIRNFDINRFWSMEADPTLLLSSAIGGVGLFEFNADKVDVLRLNNSFAEITMGADSIMQGGGDSSFSWIEPEDMQDFMYMLRTVRKTRKLTQCSYRLAATRDDGSRVWLMTKAQFLSGNEERAILLLSFIDITNLKLAENALHQERERYALINAVFNNSLIDYDPSTDTLYHSYSLQNGADTITRLNYLRDLPAYDAIHPDDRAVYGQTIARALIAPTQGILEYRDKRFTSEYNWCQLTYASLAGEDGKVVRVLGHVENIQDELILGTKGMCRRYSLDNNPRLERSAQIRLALESRDSGLCFLELSPEDELTCLFMDDRYREITQMPQGEDVLSEHTIFRNLFPDDYLNCIKALHDVLDNGQSAELICRARVNRNDMQWWQINVRRMPYAGSKYPVFMTLVRDLTPYMSLKERLNRMLLSLKEKDVPALATDERTRNLVTMGLFKVEQILDDTYPHDGQETSIAHMLDNASTAMAICVLDGDAVKPVYASDSFHKRIGVTAPVVNDLLCIVHKEDHEELRRAFTDAAEKGESSLVLRFRLPNQARLWLHTRVTQLAPPPQGKPQEYFLAFNDVTAYKNLEQKLRYSNERFDLVFENTSVSVWDYDFATKSIIQTKHSCDMHGFETIVPNVPEFLIQSGYVHPDSAERFAAMYQELADGAKTAGGVFRVKTPDRTGYWYESIRLTNVFDDAGLPYRAIGLSENVTTQYETEQLYKRELQMKRALSPEVYCTFLLNATQKSIEEAHYETETDLDVLAGVTYQTLFTTAAARVAEDDDIRDALIALSADTFLTDYEKGRRTYLFEYLHRRDDNSKAWIAMEMHLLRDPESGDLLVFLYLKDINKRKLAELSLQRDAEYDRMTGVLNKATVGEKIQRHLRNSGEAQTHALMMVDIDSFKAINDSYGHLRGDEVLMKFSQLLVKYFRATDIIGRFGGDEFVIFMKDISADALAGKLKDFNLALVQFFGTELNVAASIGAAISDQDNRDYTQLLRQADQALYQAKTAGKKCFRIYQGQ